MTHNQFIDIEHTASRALRSIANWAGPEERKRLQQAEYLLAEMRSAAQWLCDAESSEETKRVVLERLHDVFKHDLK